MNDLFNDDLFNNISLDNDIISNNTNFLKGTLNDVAKVFIDKLPEYYNSTYKIINNNIIIYDKNENIKSKINPTLDLYPENSNLYMIIEFSDDYSYINNININNDLYSSNNIIRDDEFHVFISLYALYQKFGIICKNILYYSTLGKFNEFTINTIIKLSEKNTIDEDFCKNIPNIFKITGNHNIVKQQKPNIFVIKCCSFKDEATLVQLFDSLLNQSQSKRLYFDSRTNFINNYKLIDNKEQFTLEFYNCFASCDINDILYNYLIITKETVNKLKTLIK